MLEQSSCALISDQLADVTNIGADGLAQNGWAIKNNHAVTTKNNTQGMIASTLRALCERNSSVSTMRKASS